MTIFITGATSGFGKAITEKFAANKWNCIITGRRKERLLSLADELQKQHGVKVLPLAFDIRNREEVLQQINSLSDEWKNIDVLVNNAGGAHGRDSFDTGSLDDYDTMIQTNLNGLIYASKAILPLMIKNKKGHLINMGSVAAKDMYQYGNVYCAAKAAVDALSHTMRVDLLPHNIKVTAIHPGAAETEFSLVRFKGDTEKAAQVYKGFQPLHANDIADITYYCATLPPHVCINDLVVTPTAQADGIYFHKQ
jgi:3-hydroxy acid dehydrogenase / malonic semialdehyde reductase